MAWQWNTHDRSQYDVIGGLVRHMRDALSMLQKKVQGSVPNWRARSET